MNEWISFANKKPNDGQRCYVTHIINCCELKESVLRYKDGEWFDGEHKTYIKAFSWIPIPDPIKEDIFYE